MHRGGAESGESTTNVSPSGVCQLAGRPGSAKIFVGGEITEIWPQLAPIMMILVVLRFGSAMAVIDEYLIFGGFNRASPTYTWTVFMYDQAFHTGLWRQGYAAAIGMIGATAILIASSGLNPASTRSSSSR